MPVLNKDLLAKRLRQNWVTKYPMDGVATVSQSLDDSLTSLNWLHNLNIMNIAGSQIGDPVTSADELQVNQNVIVSSSNPVSPCFDTGDVALSCTVDQIDYKSNPFVKPPYSYATLICMAMRETKKRKITLSSIYNWITKNFMYYRMADPSWQNSIRHNLSLNKCFEKLPRRKDEPGKGGFWRINPEFSDTLENGVFKKRRISQDHMHGAMRIKLELDTDGDEYGGEMKENFNTEDDPNFGVGLVHFGEDGHDLEADEINWRAILNQDISVEGTRVKTEQLVDVTDDLASPLIAMSPPLSDGYTDELGLDSLLSNDIFGTRDTLDIPTSPLDLTVTGTSILPPEWWMDTDNINILEDTRIEIKMPVTSSPIHQTNFCDYGREYLDELAAAFDVENIFDIDNIPSPHMV